MLKVTKIIAAIQVVIVCFGLLKHDDTIIFDPLFMSGALAALLIPVVFILAIIAKIRNKPFDLMILAILFTNAVAVLGGFIAWLIY